MRSHAKAASAGSTLGRGNGLGSLRRAFATRESSLGSAGSGAASHRGHRGRLTAVGLVIAAFILLVPFASAKVPTNGFGSLPAANARNNLGGQFRDIKGIAVNDSGVGVAQGTVYAVDGNANGEAVEHTSRLQRFSPTGVWQRAWGQDVIASSINEEQVLTFNATGGTYTLSFKGQTTDAIPTDASNLKVWEKLVSLSTIGGFANLGQPSGIIDDPSRGFLFTFVGTLAATNVPQITVDTSELKGTASFSTLVDGHSVPEDTGSGFEICTVASDCQGGSRSATTANGGQLNEPQGVAVNQANGHVYVTEGGNHRVSEFDADGNFIRTWGWDVIASGEPDDTGTGFEICEVASECQQGAPGSNGGEFGFNIGYPVTDSSNDVWISDPNNRRIQEFDPSGHFIAAYGYEVDALGGSGELEKCTSLVAGACQAGTEGSGAGQFANNSPSDIAFDSAGNLYAIDSGNNRVEKFNPTLTSEADFGSSTFSAYTTRAPRHVVATQGGTRLDFSVENDVTASPEESQILELDPTDASVKGTSLVGAQVGSFPGIGGLAADATGNLYASVGFPSSVLVLGATPPGPVLTTGQTNVKTDTTATLTGTVDPQGAWVGCKFQYSIDQITWRDVNEPDCGSLEINGGVQSISQSVGGLDPNTRYFVRLQVSRPLTANSTTTSSATAFTTVAPPPVITDIGAIDIGDKSTRMLATIDPRNTPTGYVFQYGATPALGSSTAPLAIGSGTTPIVVSQLVGGLSPDTTYYYKVVASNLTGTTTTATHTFRTRATSLPLPEGRAYEQVTPPDKNYGDANSGGFGYDRSGVSVNGDAVGYCSTGIFGDPPSHMNGYCAPYISRRELSGWQTPNDFPSFCRFDPISGNEGMLNVIPSADFSGVVFGTPESEGCPIPPLNPTASFIPGRVADNFYVQNPAGAPHTYDLLNPHLDPLHSTGEDIDAGSEDYGHIVFQSEINQTAEPDSPPNGEFTKLYDWEQQGQGTCLQAGGCRTLVTKDTHDVPFETPSYFPATDAAVQGPKMRLDGAVSRDGDRIYFENQMAVAPTSGGEHPCNEAGCELFMRENATTTTYDVSASECTFSCGPPPQESADMFVSATPSGNDAFFTSCAKLTDESNPGACAVEAGPYDNGRILVSHLYRWDRNAAPGHRLIDLTVDHEPSDGTNPNFRALIGSSDDGETAYFVTAGQIVAGQPTFGAVVHGSVVNGAREGYAETGLKIYRWRYNGGNPTVDYLGPYASFLGPQRADPNWFGFFREVTPDGKYLMLFSKERLDPAADHDADADVYRWDEADGWTCASCQSPGAPSSGDVDLGNVWFEYARNPFENEIGNDQPKTEISNDGQRIFFATPDALVPQDVNGEGGCPGGNPTHRWEPMVYRCEDVYEWHDGTISLVSSGTSPEPSRLIGASRSGGDVFFYTRDRLVGWDQDNGTDIYDARIGGGFPEPLPQPPTCEGEACRGQGSSAPNVPGAGTAAFQGPPNPTPGGEAKQHKRKKHHKRKAKNHKRAAKHNRRAGR